MRNRIRGENQWPERVPAPLKKDWIDGKPGRPTNESLRLRAESKIPVSAEELIENRKEIFEQGQKSEAAFKEAIANHNPIEVRMRVGVAFNEAPGHNTSIDLETLLKQEEIGKPKRRKKKNVK